MWWGYSGTLLGLFIQCSLFSTLLCNWLVFILPFRVYIYNTGVISEDCIRTLSKSFLNCHIWRFRMYLGAEEIGSPSLML